MNQAVYRYQPNRLAIATVVLTGANLTTTWLDVNDRTRSPAAQNLMPSHKEPEWHRSTIPKAIVSQKKRKKEGRWMVPQDPNPSSDLLPS